MPAKCCFQMKESMAAFFGSDSVAISCHCKRSKIILVKVFTGVCSLENIASWNWRKNALTWSDSVLLAVFILEDALSVQTDNASMAVFILRTHYPTGRTWANICSSSGYASQV